MTNPHPYLPKTSDEIEALNLNTVTLWQRAAALGTVIDGQHRLAALDSLFERDDDEQDEQ